MITWAIIAGLGISMVLLMRHSCNYYLSPPLVMPDTDPLRFVNDAHNRLISYRIELNESLPTHPELLDYYIGVCVAEMIATGQANIEDAINQMNEARASMKALLDKQDNVGEGQIW